MADYISYAVSGVVLFGGIIGYVKAGSMMSLGSGIIFGGLIGYGAYRVSMNPKDFLFLLVVSGILCGMMSFRFYKSGKFMPAGLVAMINLFQVLRFGYKLFF